jgi:hypothetical protein
MVRDQNEFEIWSFKNHSFLTKKVNETNPQGILCSKRSFFLPTIQVEEIYNKKLQTF